MMQIMQCDSRIPFGAPGQASRYAWKPSRYSARIRQQGTLSRLDVAQTLAQHEAFAFTMEGAAKNRRDWDAWVDRKAAVCRLNSYMRKHAVYNLLRQSLRSILDEHEAIRRCCFYQLCCCLIVVLGYINQGWTEACWTHGQILSHEERWQYPKKISTSQRGALNYQTAWQQVAVMPVLRPC